MRRSGSGLILGCVVAIGCGGGNSNGISEATIASFEGVYALETATENPSSCDAEGGSNLDTFAQRRFIAIGLHVLTSSGLQIISCADDDACAATAAKVRAGQGWASQWGWFMSSEVGPDEVTGFLAGSGFPIEGSCIGREYADLSFSREGNAVRIESRTTQLAYVPVDKDGICWADPSKQIKEAAGRPCTTLAVMTGTKRGPLP